MTIKAVVYGVSEAIHFLDSKLSKTKSETQKGLFNAAVFLQGEIKSSIAGQRQEHVSVDTGRFLNSVDINVGKEDAIVFSNVPYAGFLEFGTSRFPGRKHFNNSKDRNKQKIQSILQTAINKV